MSGADGTSPPQAADASRPRFIVGVGASAGGLEAVEALLAALRLDSLAVVVVQHLLPTHDSALTQILSRATALPVSTAADGMTVGRNRVYVIPPNATLAIADGKLALSPLVDDGGRRGAIDTFFRALARDQGQRAAGVVLSGTGSDGTLGLQAIKEAGGITFVQEPASARFDGMPRAAMESGWADFCGTPADIGSELMKLHDHPYLAVVDREALVDHEGLRKVLAVLRGAFGHDLTHYKPAMIERRTERRMALHELTRSEDYLKLLQSDPAELRALYKDLLIGVTNFFRDHDPFEALKARVLPQIAARKRPGTTIRAWVPACSSGEEAYSLAISLLEYVDAEGPELRVQIFATDVDEDAVRRARRGVYPQHIELDVSPERLHRFFVRNDDGFQINRRVRDMVVFSTQDVTRDAPFSRLDLVSCRNLLIYLQPPMQQRIMRVFHYALQPAGFLLLGSSETVGDSADLFSLADRKNKIYVCKHLSAQSLLEVDAGGPRRTAEGASAVGMARPVRKPINLAALADRKVLDLYGPPGVVVNEHLDILHFRGRTSPYLEPAPGAASLNLLRLARPELQAELRRALHQATEEDKPVSVGAHITDGDTRRDFRLEVLPIVDPDSKSRCLLVLFHTPHAVTELPPPSAAGTPSDHRVENLELELLLTKEYLQSAIGELEGANEELRASNEEMQSSNEELQSTNEELETSKEEIQSTNEELTTVNEELQTRMAELQQTHDDLYNVLTGVDNAVVIAGLDLRIRRFTNAAERLLGLAAADVGRPLSFIEHFVGRRLEPLTARVIDSLRPVEEEVQCADRRWYLLRVLPYKTLEHAINGAVIVLTDIDVRKRSAQMHADAASYAAEFLQVIDRPLAILDGHLRLVWVNPQFYRLFQVVPEETLGHPMAELGGGQWNEPTLGPLIAETLASGGAFRDVVVPNPVAGGRALQVSGSRIPQLRDEGALVLLTFDDRPQP